MALKARKPFPLIPGEIEIRRYNTRLMCWEPAIEKGVVYEVDGEQIELFKLRVLAETIHYAAGHIKRWEREQKFPKPTFKVTHGRKFTRYYSKVQIANIRALYSKYVNLYHAQGGRFQVNEFLKEVRLVFYQRHMLPEAVASQEVR
jgi:hypothetical protein